MAYTTLDTANRMERWRKEYFVEYVREHSFGPYMGDTMGEGSMMPIQACYELTDGGKSINIPFIEALSNAGVQGTNTLTGNEGALGNHNQKITVNWNRNAVTIKKPERHWSEFDLLDRVKPALQVWNMERLRDDIICAMLAYSGGSILRGKDADDTNDTVVAPLAYYTGISEAVKDAWLAANADRFLFGNAASNNASNDHSASLANVDVTNDRMSAAHVSLAKQLVREQTDRRIRPVKQSVSKGRDDFVYFVGSRAFRDLKQDGAIVQANRDARVRGTADNPLFRDGDLLWDGVIIREIPEIPVITGVGASSADVQPGFFCGAGAAAVAWGQRPETTKKDSTDYQFEVGRGIEECRGVAKMVWNGVQNGVFNTFVAAPATA
ncbi:MAG: DUF4043 family protein [Pseudomonadota bacterium]